jgi:hypothetical protein
MGMCAVTWADFSGSSTHARLMGVIVAPGATALTRMPRSAYSRASVRVRFCMPPFDTE